MIYADRVKETATTTGTSDFTLDGAATQYISFNTAFGTGVPFNYVIQGQSGSEWEVGQGYLSGATTLVREVVTASSNSGALVNFSSGTKDVFHTATAAALTTDTGGSVLALSQANYLR